MAFGNIRKTVNYLKKNGIEDTFYASMERITGKQDYSFIPVSDEVLEAQRKKIWPDPVMFSIVVPAYETKETFLRACIDSVLKQTYRNFELIIADASRLAGVRKVCESYSDHRLKYMHLQENKGISINTNAAIRTANGDYVGLLDHDDMLTPDCLYEYATLIEKNSKEKGSGFAFIYCDEDKCDAGGDKFFEPNYKPGFNLDLLLTNNYICHFLVMKTSLIKELALRSDYDGAQDHDLVLRAYAATNETSDEKPLSYGHISRILYHWRCHNESTASNPESKTYAYEAGRRAVADYLKRAGIAADVEHSKHNGFFRIEYRDELVYPKTGDIVKRRDELKSTVRGRTAYNTFLNRYDVGAIGGPLIKDGKIAGGLMDSTKTCIYDGLNVHFSGYMHRASLQQDALYLDIRNMMLVDDLAGLLIKIARDERNLHLFNRELISELESQIEGNTINAPYVDVSAYLAPLNYDEIDYLNAGVDLSREVSFEGYLNLYDPRFVYEDAGSKDRK